MDFPPHQQYWSKRGLGVVVSDLGAAGVTVVTLMTHSPGFRPCPDPQPGDALTTEPGGSCRRSGRSDVVCTPRSIPV
jgi:hypothetical protein